MRFPKLTIRRLMVAVAILGVLLGGLVERRGRFGRIAAGHRDEWGKLMQKPVMFAGSTEWLGRLEWHEAMRRKYERAARYPWLPVAPDPPEPEDAR